MLRDMSNINKKQNMLTPRQRAEILSPQQQQQQQPEEVKPARGWEIKLLSSITFISRSLAFHWKKDDFISQKTK